MADTIDAFVVSLGLDPSNYNREIRKYRDDRKRLAEEDQKYDRQSQDGSKRQVEALRSLRNETTGFLLTLAGASSVGSFFSQMVSGAADTGRLAQNLGIATERVGVWEAAVKRAGGTAEGAQSALRLMSSLFQQNRLGILDPGTQGDLMGLGISKLSQDPEQNLMAISQASTRMDRQQFVARASRLGLDQGTINVLAEGPDKLRATLREMEKLNVTTEAQAEEARKLEKAWQDTSDTLKTLVRPALFEAVTELNDFTSKLLKFAELLKGWEFRDPWEVIKEAFAGAANPQERPSGVTFSERPLPWYQRLWNTITRQTTPGQSTPSPMAQGLGGGGNTPVDRTGRAATAERFWRAKGFTAEQARGITAAMVAENGKLSPGELNPVGGNLGAYGLGQWRGSRQRALRNRYGPNPTFEQQLEFMHSEMYSADGKWAGHEIRSAASADSAARSMIDRFYRPGAGTAGDYRRAGNYIGGKGFAASARPGNRTSNRTNNSTQTTYVGTIEIRTDGKSADQIAKDMRNELAKRGLTTQANTGLQP